MNSTYLKSVFQLRNLMDEKNAEKPIPFSIIIKHFYAGSQSKKSYS
ncbi:MAG: hypothetical protein OFPII_36990 [Osedax symbiont Rs1]|nr:MAG: hypothetical protein OFPII_36990 [Osedax symbiont Rs1]